MSTENNTEPVSANMSLAQLTAKLAKRTTAPAAASATEGHDTSQPDDAPLSEHAEAEAESADSSLESETAGEAAEAAGEDNETTDPDGEGEELEAGADPKEAKTVSKLLKRLHKLTARAKVAEDRLAAVEAAGGGEAKAKQATQRDEMLDGTLARERSITQLDGEIIKLRQYEEWSDINPDGGRFSEDGKDYELSADEVRSYRRQAAERRMTLLSKREARMESLRGEFASQQKAAHAEAVKLYPWIEKSDTAEFQEAVRLVRENPAITHRADWEILIARQVAGSRLESEARKAKAPLRTGAKPPPVITHSASAAPSKPREQAKSSQAEQDFKATGRTGDLAKLFAQKRRSRTQAA